MVRRVFKSCLWENKKHYWTWYPGLSPWRRVCGVRRWLQCRAVEVQTHSSTYPSQPAAGCRTSHPQTTRTPGRRQKTEQVEQQHSLCLWSVKKWQIVWMQTCKLRSTSQLVSKSSSSSPKGFMSCSATWEHEQYSSETDKGITFCVQHQCKVVPHLQPTNIEEKLQQGENGQVEVHIVTGVPLSWIQELTTNQTSQEEAVDRHCRHLVKRD